MITGVSVVGKGGSRQRSLSPLRRSQAGDCIGDERKYAGVLALRRGG
jgi:hypothetical protein